MVQKVLIAGAEIVQPRLSIRGIDKAILRALPVAGKFDIAAPAVFGKGCLLIGSESLLCRRIDKRFNRRLIDIPQSILRRNKMIARVEVSGMFNRQCPAAGFTEETQC